MSMGALLLAGGAAGKRMSLPNSQILIHQVSAGFQGQATDIEIHAKEIIECVVASTRSSPSTPGQSSEGQRKTRT